MYYVDGSLYDNYPIFNANKNYDISEILGFLILGNFIGSSKG
jgi:hypothetical protein